MPRKFKSYNAHRGHKIRNQWGTLQKVSGSSVGISAPRDGPPDTADTAFDDGDGGSSTSDDVFADPRSVQSVDAYHYHFQEFSTGERTLALYSLGREQPRILEARRDYKPSDADAVRDRFGFRRLLDTFGDQTGHVELWELGDFSLATRIVDRKGNAFILVEVQSDYPHRPF